MDNQLSTEIFYGMILTGARQVIINEGELNQLNVFPVADRDTGTNLASMMRYIIDNLSITQGPEELLHQLSQHGLVGCSGNSGLIFSQFFYGLTQHKLANKTFVKLQEFAAMLVSGYKSAYASVSSPAPGTILTVMERWVASYRELVSNTKATLIESFQKSVDKARDALKDTINQLEILRQNQVVDAGAQGFIHFIEGMLCYLKASPNLRRQLLKERLANNDRLEVKHEFENLVNLPNYRYCFEVVVKTSAINGILEQNRSYLESLGDSMVIGQALQMEKLHIHTNNPKLITRHLAKVSDIVYQKIDDMVMQYNVANSKQEDIALVIDSMADVPLEWVWQNNIFSFPLQIKVNNHSFLDKCAINFQDTVTYLRHKDTQVRTSAPSVASVSRGLQFLAQNYKSLIILPIAKSLSSTYDVIANQALRVTGCKIKVIDSCMISGALGLLVIYANQLIKAKQYDMNEIVRQIEKAKQNIHFLVFINSLDELIKSGRLSKPVGIIAKLLHVKPIVKLESSGRPKIVGVSFSRKGGWKKLIKLVNKLKVSNELKTLSIVHSTSSRMACIFKHYVTKYTKIEPLYVTEASSVAVAHTGGDGVAIAYSVDEIKL